MAPGASHRPDSGSAGRRTPTTGTTTTPGTATTTTPRRRLQERRSADRRHPQAPAGAHPGAPAPARRRAQAGRRRVGAAASGDPARDARRQHTGARPDRPQPSRWHRGRVERGRASPRRARPGPAADARRVPAVDDADAVRGVREPRLAAVELGTAAASARRTSTPQLARDRRAAGRASRSAACARRASCRACPPPTTAGCERALESRPSPSQQQQLVRAGRDRPRAQRQQQRRGPGPCAAGWPRRSPGCGDEHDARLAHDRSAAGRSCSSRCRGAPGAPSALPIELDARKPPARGAASLRSPRSRKPASWPGPRRQLRAPGRRSAPSARRTRARRRRRRATSRLRAPRPRVRRPTRSSAPSRQQQDGARARPADIRADLRLWRDGDAADRQLRLVHVQPLPAARARRRASEPVVVRNDELALARARAPSAGTASSSRRAPAAPSASATSASAATRSRRHEVPVLGVCLGHQGLAHVRGGERRPAAADSCTARISPIFHRGDGALQRASRRASAPSATTRSSSSRRCRPSSRRSPGPTTAR